MSKSNMCPLPWISLSVGAKDSPRLCCHQNGLYPQSGSLLKLDHAKEAREVMLAGKMPVECGHCTSLEEANCRSPRQDYLERFTFEEKSVPVIKYLDLTVDNDCNLECVMCSPLYSRKLHSFYEKELKISAEKNWVTSLTNEDISGLIPNLEQVTLTGGEPFLSKRSVDIIRHIATSGRAHEIVLRVFTNLSHLPVELLKDLNAFKKLELILSIDSVEDNYELMRFPAKWNNLLQNIEKIKQQTFRELDLHQHTVVTAANWTKMGEIIRFFTRTFPTSFNIIPIFVEIDTPGILHPRVLPESQWSEGKRAALTALDELMPRNDAHRGQIENFRNLIVKMEQKNHRDRYMDYQIYLQKVKAHRKERQPHGA